MKANDTINDYNYVMTQMNINYILRITKIVIVVANFSYLLGMFWYIMAKLIEDFYDHDYNSEDGPGEDG